MRKRLFKKIYRLPPLSKKGKTISQVIETFPQVATHEVGLYKDSKRRLRIGHFLRFEGEAHLVPPLLSYRSRIHTHTSRSINPRGETVFDEEGASRITASDLVNLFQYKKLFKLKHDSIRFDHAIVINRDGAVIGSIAYRVGKNFLINAKKDPRYRRIAAEMNNLRAIENKPELTSEEHSDYIQRLQAITNILKKWGMQIRYVPRKGFEYTHDNGFVSKN